MRALILAPFSATQIERVSRRLDVVHESWLDTGRLWDPEDLGKRIAGDDIDMRVIEADFAFAELFEAAPGLKLVGTCRNALNHIDVEAATASGVAVVPAPGRNTNAVAEMTVACMLALARRLPEAHHLVSGGGWRDPAVGYRELRGRELGGSTVGIVGFGAIGRAVARLVAAFGASVVVSDPLVSVEEVTAAGARAVELSELAATADFVTLHVPENESTHHLVGRNFLAAMRSDAYLINTGAGACVDPDVLAEALTQGRIAGAALDVFEGQPLPSASPLMSAPNLLLTPHIAGATAETIERHSTMIADDIERFLDGEPLKRLVNPDYKLARVG
jgi:phosphoglycerate dehydrogenase-like enzyme